ncbi:MAG: FAD:protein FMN transferase [Burkholderiales bacterium]|nr:FAD:protein FMN transferase [Burkholderiales bacterium]
MHDMLQPQGLTRRRMAMALPLLGAAAWLPAAQAAAPAPVARARRALMGTQVDLVAQGADERLLHAAMDRAWAEMERLTALMSRYEPTSTVSAINQAAGRRAVPVEPAVMAVLQAAQSIAAQTQGAFDATVGALQAWQFGAPGALPAAQTIAAQRRLVGYRNLVLDTAAGTAFLKEAGMALDLGGIAKLPILQAGMDTLHAQGVEHAMLNGGGDVLVRGQLNGRAWRVGLRDPLAPDKLLGVLPVQGQAIVASSGDYERFFMAQGERQHHILDPHTGYPTRGPHGVSLLARDAASVNGLGTALMVLGSRSAPALLHTRPGVEALVVERDRSRWQTPGMARALQSA